MKIGTFYRHLVHFVYKGAVKNIPEALEMLLPLGLSCVDVPTDFLQEKFRPKLELSELKSAGISVSSVIHAVSFDDMTGSRIAGLKEDTARQLERCADSVAIGRGSVPVKEISSFLLAKHYEGVWSIEINDENELLQKLKDSLRFLS